MPFLNELDTLAKNPNVNVLSCLHKGALRFSELLGQDFVADEKTLNESLRELDQAGLVKRRVDPGPPLRVLYALTAPGARLAPTLESLATWVRHSEDAGPVRQS